MIKNRKRLLIFSIITVLIITCMGAAVIVPANAHNNETENKENLAFVYLETGEQKVVHLYP